MLDGKQVLIVEDDPVTAVVLQAMLVKLGAAVARQQVRPAWQALAAQRFDLVFLDLGLGDAEAEALLRALRQGSDAALPDPRTPVVVITGRHDLDARVRLLEAGADQFVMKPFDLRELQAMARTVFRRRAHRGRLRDRGELELDAAQRVCRYRGRLVVLTRAEFDILLCLARSYPQAVPSAGLLKDAGDAARSATALHVQIHHLRQKLDPAAIETVHGLGYRLGEGRLADASPRPLAA